MTFKVDGFSVPKLEERLTDLIEQKIFLPQAILIDGLPFDKDMRESLAELKKLAESHSMHVWFTVRTHRHEEPCPNGMPVSLLNVTDLFDIIIQLQPEGKEIHVKALKGVPAACDYPELLLDPSTMLVKG